jgi:hypothetical protein
MTTIPSGALIQKMLTEPGFGDANHPMPEVLGDGGGVGSLGSAPEHPTANDAGVAAPTAANPEARRNDRRDRSGIECFLRSHNRRRSLRQSVGGF